MIPYSFVGDESLFLNKLKSERKPTIKNKLLFPVFHSKRNDKENAHNIDTPPNPILKIVDNLEVNRIYDQIQSRVNKSSVRAF